MLNGFAFLHADPREHAFQSISAEQSEQIVFHRQEEAAGTGVALASGTASQLQVDTAGFVAFATDDVQATQRGDFAALNHHAILLGDLLGEGVPFGFGDVQAAAILRLQLLPDHRFGIAAENNVSPATGHVRGNCHGVETAGLSNDFGFALVMLGVQHLVLHAVFGQAM